jgi:Radical SAM superfamily
MYFHLLLNKCLCDYRCIFCSMGGTLHIARARGEVHELDAAEEWARIERVLREGAADPESDALHIMGNDPSNHPDLVRAVSFARELGFHTIVLETIGIRLEDPAFAAQLVDAGVTEFKIPLYGSTAEVHDAIVRLPGAHARVLKVLENLARHPVALQVHALLLKSNIADLPALLGRYPMSFRYPFRHDQADFAYAHYAPRLTEIPESLLGHSDIDVPCISGRSGGEDRVELRMRPEAGGERDDDPHTRKHRPNKCRPEDCREYEACRGMYREYYELYGEDEFEPL